MNLLRSFHLTVEDKHSDLISLYRCFFNSRLHQQEDTQQGIYRKWMPMPENDYAYILDISKASTAQRLDNLLEGSEKQEADTGLLIFHEVTQDEKFIRVVRINPKTRQTEQFSTMVLVHTVSQEQIEIQRECLKKHEKVDRKQINPKRNSVADRTKEIIKDTEEVSDSWSIFDDSNNQEEDSLQEIAQIRQKLEDNKKKEEKGTEEYPIIVNEDIQNQQEKLLENIHRKQQAISALKIELTIATEKAKELSEKVQASEEKAEENDLLRRNAVQQKIEKELQVQQMILLVKQKQEEIDGLKQENKTVSGLQKEVNALNAEAETLRKQLLQAEESRLSFVHLKELFKKKLHLEMMIKEKLVAKSQKKQAKIKELRLQVQAQESREKEAQIQREKDDEHFQQVQEYLLKELNSMKEQKEEAENQLEKYKNVFKKKASVKINKKYLDEKERNQRKEERIEERRKDNVIKMPEVNREIGNVTPRRKRDVMDNNMAQVIGVNSAVKTRSNSRNGERKISDFQSQQSSIVSGESQQLHSQQQSILEVYNSYYNSNQDPLKIFSQEQNPVLSQSQQIATPQKSKKSGYHSPSPSRNKIQLTPSQIATIQEQKAFNQRLLENGEYSAVKLDTINKCCDEFKELCSLAKAAATSLEFNNQFSSLKDQLESDNFPLLLSPVRMKKKSNLPGKQQQIVGSSQRYHIKEALQKKANPKKLPAGAIAKNAIINPFNSQLKKLQNQSAIKSSGQQR